MRKSKLDTPHIKEMVVKQLAVGQSQNSIAEQVGLDQAQISRWISKGNIRELIENEQKRLLEVVPDAVESLISLVKEWKSTPKDDIKGRELVFKGIKEVLKAAGLLPTPIHSQTLINLYQDNREFLSPRILQILDNSDLEEGIPEEIDLEHLND